MDAVTDPARIAKVLRHPSIWPHISDDLTPAEWAPPVDASRVYLMPDDDGACFVFSHHSGALAEGHFCVLPEARRDSDALAERALQWLRDNTDLKALVGFVRAGNRPARSYVKRLGFAESGTLPQAALVGGRHMDVMIYTRTL